MDGTMQQLLMNRKVGNCNNCPQEACNQKIEWEFPILSIYQSIDEDKSEGKE